LVCRYTAIAASVLIGGLAAAGPVMAADAKGTAETPDVSEFASVPGDDIFGFTSPTDLGKAGDSAVGLENDGRIGKRDGRYGVLTNKLEFSRTITDNFWVAASLFGAYHNMQGVTVQPADRTVDNFDGISGEFAYKFLERSSGNPFAATVSVEPRWGRIDGPSGIHAESWSAEFKLFIDAPIVPDKLFWGFNANWAPGVQQVVGSTSDLARNSSVNLSTAVTYAITPTVMIGAEAKYLGSFGDYFFRSAQGHAFFVGPTVFWKINDTMALNAVFLPQLAGSAATTPGLRLDLDNFERAIFRVKFAAAF
jgi:hypothetical protein